MDLKTASIESPIFVVGTGRSGTTLMQRMLSAHSKISITPETHFMRWVSERENILGSPRNFDTFWNEYTSWFRFTYLGLDADRCLELIDQLGARSFKNIFSAIMLAHMERCGKERTGEKSPSHVNYLPLLLEWFPNARFIIMQRDPRAVVASKLGTPWVKDRITPTSLRQGVFTKSRWHELLKGADDWSNIFGTIVPKWEKDHRIYVVSYEELCHNPDIVARTICNFLGEKYETAMLTDRKDDREMIQKETVPSKRYNHHQKTLKPISTDTLNKWKKNLTPVEIAIIEACCYEVMKKRKYTPSVTRLKRFGGQISTVAFNSAERSEDKLRKIVETMRRNLS